MPAAQRQELLPRIIRAMDAPAYLGMCRSEFKAQVRPHVKEFPIGKQGIGFDRYELDEWMDNYIEQKAIAKARSEPEDKSRSERQGEQPWREKPSRASTRGTGSGTSTKSLEVTDFKKALAQAKGKKRSST